MIGFDDGNGGDGGRTNSPGPGGRPTTSGGQNANGGGRERTRRDFYNRFTNNTPWVNDPNWLQGQQDAYDSYYAKANADGTVTAQERQQLQRLRRRNNAAQSAYNNWSKTQAGGDPTSPDGGGVFDQSAFDSMEQLLQEYGLTELSDFLKNLILGGTTDSASIMLALQQTDAWKRRFAGNEALRQQGFGVLSPAEYLATERAYAQVMRNYGLPTGFYDDPTDFAKFIGNNISANELQQRVSAYADLAGREDKGMKDQLASMGLGEGDLLAYMIDPTRANPLIQRKYQTALIGGAARNAGMVEDNNYLESLAAKGVTEDQASQGFGLIAGSLNDANTLAHVYGIDYGQGDMQSEIFDNNGKAANKRKRLASQERAAFSGSAGVGSLTQNSAGSY